MWTFWAVKIRVPTGYVSGVKQEKYKQRSQPHRCHSSSKYIIRGSTDYLERRVHWAEPISYKHHNISNISLWADISIATSTGLSKLVTSMSTWVNLINHERGNRKSGIFFLWPQYCLFPSWPLCRSNDVLLKQNENLLCYHSRKRKHTLIKWESHHCKYQVSSQGYYFNLVQIKHSRMQIILFYDLNLRSFPIDHAINLTLNLKSSVRKRDCENISRPANHPHSCSQTYVKSVLKQQTRPNPVNCREVIEGLFSICHQQKQQ